MLGKQCICFVKTCVFDTYLWYCHVKYKVRYKAKVFWNMKSGGPIRFVGYNIRIENLVWLSSSWLAHLPNTLMNSTHKQLVGRNWRHQAVIHFQLLRYFAFFLISMLLQNVKQTSNSTSSPHSGLLRMRHVPRLSGGVTGVRRSRLPPRFPTRHPRLAAPLPVALAEQISEQIAATREVFSQWPRAYQSVVCPVSGESRLKGRQDMTAFFIDVVCYREDRKSVNRQVK